jgi:hypothetical protein
MKILFAIAVLSFAALVWAALAIVRHVRKSSARTAAHPAADTAMSEAIDIRLSELAGQPHKQGGAASADEERAFSSFYGDPARSLSNRKPSADATAPIEPAVADRP